MSQYGLISHSHPLQKKVTVTSIDHTDSPYTALADDHYISCDVSSGNITIKLPDAPEKGRIYRIKDSFGNSNLNYITIETVLATTQLDGELYKKINMNFESLSFIFNGTSWEIF
ncbi:MAG: hypothetical protein E3J43_08615 [Candidatus Heimdallarchaeota archaeon]|nr:MAG: hypothetical protein E3J43_08615 [Candidatus Heimdallarchaeota archaeon]